MRESTGISNLTPEIIKYPFVKLSNAVINLCLGRKIFSSIAIILAALLGIGIGYLFPGIGAFIGLAINMFLGTPISTAAITGVSMVVSMLLASSILIYAVRELFKTYYLSVYGVSNPDLIFTNKDREVLSLILSEKYNDPEIVAQKINDIEERILFLQGQIKIYRLTKLDNNTKKSNAKSAIADLKSGGEDIFNQFFLTQFVENLERLDRLRRREDKARRGKSVAGERDSELDQMNVDDNDSEIASIAGEDSQPVFDPRFYQDMTGELDSLSAGLDSVTATATATGDMVKHLSVSLYGSNTGQSSQSEHASSPDKASQSGQDKQPSSGRVVVPNRATLPLS